MKICIVGYGLEGQAAYEYWKDKGDITVCDVNEVEVPDDVRLESGPDYLKNIAGFDIIVRSPIIRPSTLLEAVGEDISTKITSCTNEFFRVCPSNNIIGVTGTKGKGTTSTLIAEMLKAAGKRVHLGGNIGLPALSLLKEDIAPDDWIVLELSSFQLIDCRYSPHIGVCLMVVPEHLDWHANEEEYFNAKASLFKHQSSDDIAIYYAENRVSREIASSGEGRKIPYFAEPGALVLDGSITINGNRICDLEKLGLKGSHNWQNACAAVTAVWQITRDSLALKEVLESFTGLEHRLEYVAQIDGVSYYDDSFGTTPETGIVAMQAFNSPKIIILGGSDKGASYEQLAKSVSSENVRAVVLIGDQGKSIGQALNAIGFNDTHDGGSSMEEIVKTAKGLAVPGDTVLLSPACASFDMFKNYKDRGEQFKRAVLEFAQDA